MEHQTDIANETAERPRALYECQRYFSYPQAAAYTGLSVATLRRRVKESELAVLRHGGRILIERSALDDLLHSNQDVNNSIGEEDHDKK